MAGRPSSWVREGECAGDHRGLRAGQVSTGGTRALGRAIGLLAPYPGRGGRVTTGPGGVWVLQPGPEPSGDTTNPRSRQGIGERATTRRTPRRPGGSRRVAYDRCTGGRETQATHGREGDVGQSVPWVVTRERLCAHPSCHHPSTARRAGSQNALPEEPHACMAHVRVCGRAGWVTIGSTRQPTASSFGSAALRLRFWRRLTAGVLATRGREFHC